MLDREPLPVRRRRGLYGPSHFEMQQRNDKIGQKFSGFRI